MYKIWLLCLVTTGCAHNLRDELNVKDYVRNRAAYDFSCARDKIEVLELQAKTFSATGCDKKGVYVCKYPERQWYETPNLECKAQ